VHKKEIFIISSIILTGLLIYGASTYRQFEIHYFTTDTFEFETREEVYLFNLCIGSSVQSSGRSSFASKLEKYDIISSNRISPIWRHGEQWRALSVLCGNTNEKYDAYWNLAISTNEQTVKHFWKLIYASLQNDTSNIEVIVPMLEKASLDFKSIPAIIDIYSPFLK